MRPNAKKNYDHLLAIAWTVVTERGAEASLRGVARRAGFGLGMRAYYERHHEKSNGQQCQCSASVISARSG